MLLRGTKMLVYLYVLLIVNVADCTNYTSCLDIVPVALPKNFLIWGSPFFSYFTSIEAYECSTFYFTTSKFNDVDVNTAIVVYSDSNQTLQFNYIQKGPTFVVHDCTPFHYDPTGFFKLLNYKFIKYGQTKDGFWSCSYVCDGAGFKVVHCQATCDLFVPEMLEVIESVKHIPNADKIHSALENCKSNCQNEQCTYEQCCDAK